MNSNIVERLALQVDSFQEGFEILSGAKNVQEMGKRFARILRGNFLISLVDIFYKQNPDGNWNLIYGNNANNASCLNVTQSDNLQINYNVNEKVKICVILPLTDKSLFAVTIGKKLDQSDFSEFDKITLQVFLQLLANAYQSFTNRRKEKNLIFELNQRVLQLNSLIDTGIDLAKFENKNLLLELAIERAAVLTDSSTALVKVISDDKQIDEKIFPPNFESAEIVKSENKITSSFVYQDKEYNFILANKESRSGTASYTDLDQLLLDAIVRQVSTAIENEFLHQQSIIKERIEQEINVAASIQQMIIPTELPEIKGYDVAGINIPSREVGGDYYDCINLGDGRYAFVIADVTGKGIAASLLVNTLNASLYAFLNFEISLTELTDKLNKIIFTSSPSDKFITFFIAVLNAGTGELDIVNAGHNPILLLRSDNSIEKIDAGGVGLGMFDMGIPYEGQKVNIKPGERLFLFTDGIPEAMNENEEEYSDERLEKFFLENKTDRAQEFIDKIVNDVRTFAGNTEQSDDITALYLIRKY